MAVIDLTPTLIEAEYRRLGHHLGWRFLTSPERTLNAATVALVTLNPAGKVDDVANPGWSVENGNAYLTESWRGLPTGRDPLQVQVQRMFQVAGVDIRTVLSGYLVPFRSPRWKALGNRPQSLAFGRKLWTALFARSPAKTVFAFGYDVGAEMCAVLNAGYPKEAPAHWGSLTIRSYICQGDRLLMVMPHLSTYKLFSRHDSVAAFKALLRERREEVEHG